MSATQSDARRLARAGGASADGHRKLGLALVVIATAQLMVVLDATIVNVALPDIAKALGFTGTGLEWVVNAATVAIYDHALSVGFSRGFEVSAGIMLLALIVAIVAIRLTREDLVGAAAATPGQPASAEPAAEPANS